MNVFAGYRRHMVASVAQLGAAAIFTRGLNLITLAVLARTLGTTDVGRYVLVTSLGAFAYFACDFGLGQRLAREGAACPERLYAEHLASLRRRIELASLTIAILIVWVIMRGVLGQPLSAFYPCTIAALALQTFAYEYECVGRAVGRMDVELWSTAVGSLIASAIITGGVIAEPTLAWVPVGIACGGVGRLVIAYVRSPRPVEGKPGMTPSAASLLRASAPYAVTSLLQSAFVQLDVLIISLVAGQLVTGEYALISRPLLAIGTIAAYAMNGLIPSTAVASVSEPSRAMWRVMRVAAGAVACGGLLFAIAAIAYKAFLGLVFGGEAQHVHQSVILCAALYLVFTPLNATAGSGLTGLGLQSLRGWAAFSGLVVTVGLCFLLVPPLGTLGAAIQLVASEATVSLVIVWALGGHALAVRSEAAGRQSVEGDQEVA